MREANTSTICKLLICGMLALIASVVSPRAALAIFPGVPAAFEHSVADLAQFRRGWGTGMRPQFSPSPNRQFVPLQQQQNLIQQQRQRVNQQRAFQQQRMEAMRQGRVREIARLNQVRLQQRNALEQQRKFLADQRQLAQARKQSAFAKREGIEKPNASSSTKIILPAAASLLVGGAVVTPQLQDRIARLSASEPSGRRADDNGQGDGRSEDGGGSGDAPKQTHREEFNTQATNLVKPEDRYFKQISLPLQARILKNSNRVWKVDPSFQEFDRSSGVIADGAYIKNPNSWSLISKISDFDKIKIDDTLANGKYMYVVTNNNEVIFGTRGGDVMPHPTLIGGIDPTVSAAGIIEIRGGKIYSVNNSSGHYKPDATSLLNAQKAFESLQVNIFHRNFEGYVQHDQ